MESENPAPVVTESTEPTAPKKKPFYRKPLGCLVTLLVGGFLFTVLLTLFAVWFAGSNFAVGIAADVVNKKSGGNLSIGENDSNLFAGRVHYKDIRLTNPSRFTDKDFVTINELKTDVALGSLVGDVKHIREAIIDIGCVSLVGAEKWITDNNAVDFQKAFAGDPAKEEPAKPAEPAKAGDPLRYKIDKLVIKLDRLRAVSHATKPGQSPRVIFDKEVNLSWTFTDVTETNLKSKVVEVIINDLKKFGSIGLAIGASFVGDLTTGILDTTVELGTGAIGTVTDVATGTVNAATGVVTGTVKAVGNGLSGAVTGLIGGLTGKTDEKKDEKKEETK